MKPDFAARLAEYKPGSWFDVHDIDEMEAFYRSRLPEIRQAARDHGWAIGQHGTMRRDMDLMAMPWRSDCSDHEVLVRSIHKAACGITCEAYRWEAKPLGRLATSIPVCWPNWHNMIGAGHIDLSVMPPAKP